MLNVPRRVSWSVENLRMRHHTAAVTGDMSGVSTRVAYRAIVRRAPRIGLLRDHLHWTLKSGDLLIAGRHSHWDGWFERMGKRCGWLCDTFNIRQGTG